MDRRLGPRARSSVSQASTTGARCSISRGWLPIRRGTAGGLAGPSSPFSGPARARRRSTSTSLRRHATARTVVDPSMPPAPGAWAGHPPDCLLGRRQPEGDHHPDGEDDNSPEERHIRSYADLHVRSYADMLFAAHLLRPLRTLDPRLHWSTWRRRHRHRAPPATTSHKPENHEDHELRLEYQCGRSVRLEAQAEAAGVSGLFVWPAAIACRSRRGNR